MDSTNFKEYPNAGIALYGISMGGATVMMTSGEDLPSNVKLLLKIADTQLLVMNLRIN